MGTASVNLFARLFAREPDAAVWVARDRDGFVRMVTSRFDDGELDDDQLVDLALVFGCVMGDERALAAFETEVLDRIPELRGRPDLRQDVRVHALVADDRPRLASFAARSSLVSWVRRLAQNLIVTALRRERPHDDAAIESAPGSEPSPESAVFAAEASAAFREAFAVAIADLSPRERECLRLRFVEGLAVTEVAERLAVHRETAGAWIARATRAVAASTRRELSVRHGASVGELDDEMVAAVQRGEVESLSRLLAARPR